MAGYNPPYIPEYVPSYNVPFATEIHSKDTIKDFVIQEIFCNHELFALAMDKYLQGRYGLSEDAISQILQKEFPERFL